MYISPTDPSIYLIELADLKREDKPPEVQRYVDVLMQVVHWAEEYLCRPHPQLGREGIVCPFVPSSLAHDLFFMALCPGSDFSAEEIQRTVMTYQDLFFAIKPHDAAYEQYKTILILFPDIALDDVVRVIDKNQLELKPQYVAKGLMIGQFHPLPPDEPGLWNEEFRPLRSPVPLLAIRYMVANDLPFLTREKRYVEAYLAQWQHAVPRKYRQWITALKAQFDIP